MPGAPSLSSHPDEAGRLARALSPCVGGTEGDLGVVRGGAARPAALSCAGNTSDPPRAGLEEPRARASHRAQHSSETAAGRDCQAETFSRGASSPADVLTKLQ